MPFNTTTCLFFSQTGENQTSFWQNMTVRTISMGQGKWLLSWLLLIYLFYPEWHYDLSGGSRTEEKRSQQTDMPGEEWESECNVTFSSSWITSLSTTNILGLYVHTLCVTVHLKEGKTGQTSYKNRLNMLNLAKQLQTRIESHDVSNICLCLMEYVLMLCNGLNFFFFFFLLVLTLRWMNTQIRTKANLSNQVLKEWLYV